MSEPVRPVRGDKTWNAPLRAALGYLILGTAWFGLGGFAIYRLSPVGGFATLLLTLTGIAFVVTTSAILYWAARKGVSAALALEDAKQRRDDEYHNLVEGAADGIVVLDGDGALQDVNGRFCRLVGYSRETLTGLGWTDLTPPGDWRNNGSAEGLKLPPPNTTQLQECTLLRHDAGRLPVEISIRALRPGVYQGIVRDISERKRAENALREHQEELSALMSNLPGMVYRCRNEPGWPLEFVSEGALELTGFSPEALTRTGRIRFRDIIHPGDRPRVRKEVQAAVANAGRYQITYRLTHYDGRTRWVWEQGAVVRTAARGTATLQGFITDITDRVRTQRRLARSEARFRTLVQHASDMVAVLELDTSVRYVSPAISCILGLKPEDVRGRLITSLVHPKDREALEATLREARNYTGQVLTGVFRFRRAEGGWAFIEAKGRLILDDEVRGYVFNARDITERKRLEQQFHQSQKMEALGRLAGGVAHDFNNLLTTIRSYSQTMAAAADAPEPWREQLAEITNTTDRAAGLVRQLLALSRHEEPVYGRVDLNALIEDLSHLLSRILGANVRFEHRLNAVSSLLHGDVHQIEQILMNLVVNARDAMPSGGQLTLETSNVHLEEQIRQDRLALEPGDYVLLTVSDTGTGMSRDTMECIFEPFFTTKPEDQGTGLGLATVYGLVQQHKGHIHVYSELGEGTVFRIYFPLLPEAKDTPRKSVTGRTEGGPPRGRGETVLLVEDEAALCRVIGNALQGFGYAVHPIGSPTEALKWLDESGEAPDLLITDVVMPDIPGPVLYKRAAERNPDLRVIFLSGYADAGSHGRELAPDAPFLPKPFSLNDLARMTREVLDSPPTTADTEQRAPLQLESTTQSV